MPNCLLRIIRLIASAGALACAVSGAFAVGEGANPAGARPLAPTTGTINNLVVFVRFSDQPEFAQPLSYYDGLFNTTSNSLKNFYLENSYNALTVNSSFYPTSGGTIVSYQDSHPTAYYQAYNATTNPLGYQGAESTAREVALVTNALAAISSQIPGGLNLDGNNDGFVDHITFEVYSTDANPLPVLFYSRASYDSSGAIVLNGKHIGPYTWVSSVQDSPNTGASLGAVEIHEMGHSFGYPDLRGNSGRQPVGDWDVMSTSRVVHSGAYMKNRFTNWISNIPEISAYGNYSLNDLTQSSNNSYKIRIPNSSEYLILEYRRIAGAFESNLRGSGLCITRVNEAAGIWGNLGGPPFFIYYYRLNGTTSSDGNGAAWDGCFSSETNRVQFNDHSNPACFLSDGSSCGISIASIGSSAGSSISFSLTDPSAVAITRRISGILTLGGSRVGGATVTLSGGATGVATSDSLGNYNFVVNDGGNYTVTPAKANLTFSPLNKSFTAVTSDQTQNFSATNNSNTISGTVSSGGVSLSGVTIACNGGCTPQLATTDASGAFSFTVNAGATYDVYPAGGITGYYFSPNTKNFTNITTNQTQAFTAQAITATTLGSSPNPSVSAQSVTFIATVIGGTPAGSVTFNSSGIAVCSAVPVSNGQAQCATSSLAVGNRSISAVYSGDSNTSSSTSGVLTQVVTQATATVPGSPTSATASAGNGQATVSFAAPASNGGATITGYTVTSSPAVGIDSNAGSTATSHTITGLTNGTSYTFTVKATNSAGTGAASAGSNSVTPQGTQTIGAISFSPASVAVGGATSASATATSGLAVTLSSTTTGICSVSGSTVSGVAPGTCTIAANQAGNAGYAPAPLVTQTITVGPGSQSISFGASPAIAVGSIGTVSVTGGLSGNSVILASTTPSVCTISASAVTGVAAGICTIAANQAGNANYAAAPQATQDIAVAKADQTISGITLSPPSLAVSGTTTASATATSGLAVTFSALTPAVCSINGAVVTIVSAGTCTIAANQPGNANYAAAAQISQDITTGKSSQTLSFGVIPTIALAGSGTVSATASSGLPAAYSSLTTAVCTVVGNTVTSITAGTCTIAVSQAGNTSYNPAPQATLSITIGKTAQTVSFGAAPVVVVGGTGSLAATGGASGNPVTFTSTTPSICTVSGASVTGISAGTCTIAANQAGSANHAAAAQSTQDIVVGKGAQTLTFSSDPSIVMGGSGLVSATATSSLAANYRSATPDVCEVSGNVVRGVAAGTCTIAADQAGDANYAAAVQVTQNLIIGKANQSIGSISIAALTLGVGGSSTVSATATSSLVPTFASTTPGVCSVSGTTVRGVSPGTCTVAADQIGNANYNAAPQVTQDFSVLNVAVPGAPTAVSASRESSRVTVSFNAPSSTGGSPVISYTVTSSPGGITATGSASPIALAGLGAGVTYTFTVTATNIAGRGAPSVASNEVALPQVIAQSGTRTTLSDTTPVVAAAGSALVVPSGTATAGTSITLSGSAAGTSAAPVTLTIDGQSISVQPAASDAVLVLRTVTVNGAQTLALALGSGTVAVTAASGKSMLVIGTSNTAIAAGTGGASLNQTVDGTTGAGLLAVTDGQVVLPADSFDTTALKDGKVYAGETAQFDASGRITLVRLGSASGQGGAGDPLKPGASSSIVLGAAVPDMRQASGRTGGITLVSGFAAAVAQGAGISFDATAQNASGVLNLSFDGGRLNVLPVGSVLVDTSRPDGVAVAGNKIEVTRNGLVTTIVPSVGDFSDFASRLNGISAGSTASILSDGTMRAAVNGETYLLQPGWVATRDAGAAGFSSGKDGYLNYVDSAATRQVLYPAFADLSQLTATLRMLDPNINVIAGGNGSIVARLAGTSYILLPDYATIAVPVEHAGDPWWSAANGKIFIKYSDGKAQGFLVK